MPAISHNAIAEAIYLTSKDKEETKSAFLKDVVNFLYRKRLLSKSSSILNQLEKIINKNDNRVVAKVTSAGELGHTTSLHLKHFLKERYKADEVVLQEKIDKSIIGGARVEVESEVIDLSVKNKINKLKEYLTT